MEKKESEKAPVLKGKTKAFAEAYMDYFLEVSEAADACNMKIGEAKALLKRDDVRAYINHYLHHLRLSPEEYVRHLEMIAFGDIADFYEEIDIKNEDGEVIRIKEQLKKVADIPPHLRRRIKRLKSMRTKFGVDFTIELVSREKAIELLNKILLTQETDEDNFNKYGVLVVPGFCDAEAWSKVAKQQQQAAKTPGKQQ